MNWKSIIATALITGIVTITTSIFLFWWQKDKIELTYNSIQSFPFDDTSNKLFIQQIEIKNSGNQPADDVVLVANFNDEIIEKFKITINNAIPYATESDDRSLQLNIESLNPGEMANISLLYKSKDLRSSGADISLRGKGVIGQLIGSKEENNQYQILIALFAAYAGILSFLISNARFRDKYIEIFNNVLRGKPLLVSQRDFIASTLSLYGYPARAKEYLNSGVNRQYWVEADLLAAEALLGDEELKNDTIQVLLVICNNAGISLNSKSIAYYNIARIYRSFDSYNDKVTEYLNLAKRLDEKEINARLSRDPIFQADRI